MGAIGIAAGAFGAHLLRDHVPPHDLEIWRTGTLYLMVHALALLALGLSTRRWSTARRRAASLWIGGSLLFAGTLYAMVLGGPRWLGAITPLGGIALISGWIAMAVSACDSRDR